MNPQDLLLSENLYPKQLLWDGFGIMCLEHMPLKPRDQGSNPIPEIVIYDITDFVIISFEREIKSLFPICCSPKKVFASFNLLKSSQKISKIIWGEFLKKMEEFVTELVKKN